MKIKNFIKVGLILFLALGIITVPKNVTAQSLDLTPEQLASIHMDKTATYNGDGTYTVTLETYVTGDVSVSTEEIPVDFILVLDQSTSMSDSIPGSSSRLAALKTAANTFVTNIDNMNRAAADTVSVIGFASDRDYTTFGQETEAFSGSTSYGYRDIMTNTPWNDATVVSTLVKDVDTQATTIHNSINALTASGYTAADQGMELAERIVDALGDNGHMKVVILFTDGVPTRTSASFSTAVANGAIAASYNMKQDNVTVFAIKTSNVTGTDMDTYMNAVSSNYPDATSMTVLGTRVPLPAQFYYNVTDTSALVDVFETIQNYGIVQNSVLTTETQMTDFVSDVLNVPTMDNIHVYTYDYTGGGTFSATGTELVKGVDVTVTIDSLNKSIAVTGFDYAANSCIDGEGTIPTQGKKIVLQFTTTDIDGFIGGNNVETNTPDSALYYEDEEIKPFPEPTVNVPLDYEFTANDQAIYITNNVEDVMAFFDDVSTAGIQYQIDGVTYTIDGLRNEYADVTYEIYDGATLVGEYYIPAGSSTGSFISNTLDATDLTTTHEYTIKAVVETDPALPTSTGTPVIEPLEVIDYADVYIFVPKVTTEDEVIFKGESFTADNINESSSWECNDPSIPAGLAVQGTAPTLTYSLDGGASGSIVTGDNKPTSFITYNISVFANGNDVTSSLAVGSDVQFNVYIVEGEFNITQIIDVEYSLIDISAIQGFGYEIEKLDDHGDVIETYNVALYPREGSSDSDMISDLSIGTYRIVSDDDWLVRYTNALLNPDSDPIDPDSIYITLSRDDLDFVDARDDDIANLASIGITITNTDDDITFVATKVPSYWLSDSGYTRNTIVNPD